MKIEIGCLFDVYYELEYAYFPYFVLDALFLKNKSEDIFQNERIKK